jgi:hypothetical protein
MVALLSGCGMSNPRLGYIKSPEAAPCRDADCPTLELPAPNDSESFNPATAGVMYFDDKSVAKPFVMAYAGRVWWIMKVNPGKHSVKVLPDGTNLIGGIAASAKDAISFEAQKGKRYWLFSRPGAGGFSSKTWVEEGSADRPVVGGDRNLEAHSIAASLLGGEDKAAKSHVELWWAGVPTFDKIFQAPSVERIGDVPAPAGPAKPAAANPGKGPQG